MGIDFGFKFDNTVDVPTVIMAILWLWGLFKVWLTQRDFNQQVLIMLGKRAPRDERQGLLGDVEDLKEQADMHAELIDTHHHALGMDRRHHTRRHTP